MGIFNHVRQRETQASNPFSPWLGREGVNDCFTAFGGHQKVEGREGDKRPLGEGLSKEVDWRAGMWPRRRHARRGVGRTIGRPYAPTAGATSDDDDSPFTSRAVQVERAMPR